MNWRIEAMRTAHIDAVYALERMSFSHPWGRNALKTALSSPLSCNYIAKTLNSLDNEALIAYICTQVVIDELSILKIAVSPSWRTKGVGSALLAKNMEAAATNGAVVAFLEVRPSNQAALAFYQKFNFRIIGERPNYYPETGEAALIMTKRLKEKRK